ncbi:MAG: BlaI/MecI/CopY family transcriptional regulator [Rhodothermaceae bacterium]|nr:BlaI/MecI/CopY family transcriptional regulator [Rhodothermaceae bacterium]
MAKKQTLTRREREVMDIVYELGSATANQIHDRMEKPPTNAAVRSILRILVERNHLKYEQDGPRYLYSPTVPVQKSRHSALRYVLRTFFGGSVEGAMAALLDMEESNLSEEERERVKRLIDRAQKEGR